jgi:hypothetical protein
MAMGCQTTPIDPWEPEVFITDSDNLGLIRKQGNETINCSNPEFSGYICMKEKDFIKLYGKCLDKQYK